MYAELEPMPPPSMLSRPAPILKAESLLHVSFGRRDPLPMVQFLVDFGFVPLEGTQGRRYLRSYGSASPFSVEILEGSEDRFIGFGLGTTELNDLERLAAATGTQVERDSRPGGTAYVRVADPDGNRIDLIHQRDRTAPLSTREAITAVNCPGRAERVNRPVRTAARPAPVMRLGHLVLQVSDLNLSLDWYMRHFGLLISDVQMVGDSVPALTFNRFDRGGTPTDHHSLALFGGPNARLLHVSVETLDIDAVGQGQQYLRSRGWQHHWGVGRHVLGSQFFDYWKDPVGDEWEHYADGDLLTADFPTGYWKLGLGTLWAWGHDLPPGLEPESAPPADAPTHLHDMFRALSAPARSWER